MKILWMSFTYDITKNSWLPIKNFDACVKLITFSSSEFLSAIRFFRIPLVSVFHFRLFTDAGRIPTSIIDLLFLNNLGDSRFMKIQLAIYVLIISVVLDNYILL